MKKEANNQKRKKARLHKTNLSGNEFGVILEDIGSKLDLVLEGHSVLDRKIDNLREDMDARFEQVDARFEQIDVRFEQVDARFEQIDVRFEQVFDELHVIRNDLKEKVGRDEFVLLEKRVSALEKVKKH